MAYTVLARKYRSQRFDDVVGQEPIAQTLKNAIKTDKVAHAYLFAGTRGVGKTTMARILAKSLNCLATDKPTVEPCCKCDSCVAVNAGEDIDVIEIDGATNNGVEQVRQLRENAIYRPARARFKIYIIDEVHMLTVPAFNALLKTLEEPPSHVKFIFATTEPNKVIATIQSRCQRFDFRNIPARAIAEQLGKILRQENLKYEDQLILTVAKMANGSMRDALSLIDRLISTGAEVLAGKLVEEFLGTADSQKVCNLAGCIADSNASGTLAAIQALVESGLNEVQIADALVDFFRDLMVIKSGAADSELLILTGEQLKQATELAAKFDIAGLIYNITALEKQRWSLKNSETARALLEAVLLRLTLSEHFLGIEQLAGLLKDQGQDIKKNDSRPIAAAVANVEKPVQPPPAKRSATETTGGNADWQRVLQAAGEKLAKSTLGLLNYVEQVVFADGVLTLRFGAGRDFVRQQCQANGRAEQIKSVLAGHFGRIDTLRFEMAQEQASASRPAALDSRRKNELLNDPIVKKVISEFDATVSDIEM